MDIDRSKFNKVQQQDHTLQKLGEMAKNKDRQITNKGIATEEDRKRFVIRDYTSTGFGQQKIT